MDNIVLVGFMGVGKSTIGKVLAKRLSYKFWDSDDAIEDLKGISIPDIFRAYGEKYFRELEYRLIKDMVDQTNIVISTGGGAVMNEELFATLLSETTVIHLDAALGTLYHRLEDSDDRPMLNHYDFKERIGHLYRIRHPIYMKSQHRVEVDGKTPGIIVDEILNTIKDEH